MLKAIAAFRRSASSAASSSSSRQSSAVDAQAEVEKRRREAVDATRTSRIAEQLTHEIQILLKAARPETKAEANDDTSEEPPWIQKLLELFSSEAKNTPSSTESVVEQDTVPPIPPTIRISCNVLKFWGFGCWRLRDSG